MHSSLVEKEESLRSVSAAGGCRVPDLGPALRPADNPSADTRPGPSKDTAAGIESSQPRPTQQYHTRLHFVAAYVSAAAASFKRSFWPHAVAS